MSCERLSLSFTKSQYYVETDERIKLFFDTGAFLTYRTSCYTKTGYLQNEETSFWNVHCPKLCAQNIAVAH